MATSCPTDVGRLASAVVRQHRQVHGGLCRFNAMVDVAVSRQGADAQRAVRGAARFLETQVLAHADVEDAILDALAPPPACTHDIGRLTTSHDTLRDVAANLQDIAERPTRRTRAAGLLVGVRDLLQAHVEDEWRILLPRLAHHGQQRQQQDGAHVGPSVPSPADG